MSDWLADTRFVLRGLRRTPSFAITIVATLIIGLGPVAAVFAFADGYLFRPLPFPGAERVFVVNAPGGGLRQTDTDVLRHSSVAQLGFVEWTVGHRVRGFALLIDNRRVEFYSEGVSPAFRKTLAIPIVAGRDFTDDDHQPADPAPIWLTHSFWLREFRGDPSVVGRTFATDSSGSQRVLVVGVLGPTVSSFDGANEPPGGISAEVVAAPDPRRSSTPFVRLPADMTPERAADLIARELNAAAPAADGKPRTVQLRSLVERQVAGGRPTAEVLFVAAMLVLLLAAITIVHLFLARGVSRANEVATRAALGASAWAVARVFLTEGLLLGTAGVAGGLLFGAWLARLIQSRIPPFPTGGRSLTLVPMLFDARVSIFTIVLGLVIACAATLWPLRRALTRSFVVGNRSSAGIQSAISSRLSRGILASELAVATVLIVGALFIGSGIWRYLHQPLGFDYQDRYWMNVSKTDGKPFTTVEREAALDAWRAAAGLTAVSWDGRSNSGSLEVPGRAVETKNVGILPVTSGYFEVWHLRLREGRWFSSEELSGHEAVAVVDQKFASVAWPGETAVGQSLVAAGRSLRIVGVIEPRKRSLRRAPTGQVYVPITGAEEFSTAVVWAPHATAGDLTRFAQATEQAVPGASVQVRPVTLEWLFIRETGEAQFQAPIIMMFGAMTLLMAAAGVFGLVSYLVERRLREFGIRLALGATRLDLWKFVTWQGVLPSIVGIAIGLCCAAALERLVRASVFGWDASAPLAISIAAGALLLIAVLAAVRPTIRAMRVEPASILRLE